MNKKINREPSALGKLLAFSLACLIPKGVFADSLTMTTWYPAPYGVYTNLRSTRDAYFAYQSGNVGIGTTSPGQKLQVAGGSLQLDDGRGLYYSNCFGDATIVKSSGKDTLLQICNAGNLRFVSSYPAQSEFMRITNFGNVGIGTNPGSTIKLQVRTGTNQNFGILGPQLLGNGISIHSFDDAIGTNQGFEIRGNPVIFSNSTTENMRITSSGNVGIGTTSPGARLQVGTSGDGTAALANAWNTFSSRRCKENIHPIGGALDKINRLRGVEFEWKGSGKRDMGVVAEEVGKVFPEIVDYETNGQDARGLDYSKLIAPLIEAVKAQQEEIKDQQQQIQTLRKQNEDQKTMLAAFKKELAGMQPK